MKDENVTSETLQASAGFSDSDSFIVASGDCWGGVGGYQLRQVFAAGLPLYNKQSRLSFLSLWSPSASACSSVTFYQSIVSIVLFHVVV